MHKINRCSRNILFLLTCFSLVLSLVIIKPANALESYKENYLKGLELKENGQYSEALKAFEKALTENSTEKKKVRFYGMRYGEYMPRRERGICLYQLKFYEEAFKELEASYTNLPTDEGKKYLELAKRELGKSQDIAPIGIAETPPEFNFKQAWQENRDAVAVIIGNKDYKNPDIPPVNYAINDAKMVKESLIKTFGYREGNIIFKTNATKGVFENIFGSSENYKGMLFDYITPGKSDVFVYYSGHGAPSLETRKGYILPVDGNPNNVSIGGYSLELLYGNLAKLQARSNTVVTDACFSGAPLFKKASPVGIVVKNPLIALRDTTIINSSSGTELSSWYPQKSLSLFTYYYLMALTGKADLNHDKKITLNELSSYINENVPYMARKLHAGRRQTPTFKIDNADAVLVRFK